MLRLNGRYNINTEITCGDKSISHRALIFGAIANGTSVIRNISLCCDVLATADCLRKLGANIRFDGTTATVTPIKVPNNNVTLYCANSGTTARLLAGLVAGLNVRAKFTGDQSLEKRPMDRVLNPLRKMGAVFTKSDGCLFDSCGGALRGQTICAEVNSAQVKSAVLIAGLFATGRTTYVEKVPTRNHTELLLQYLNADIEVDGLSVSVGLSGVNAFDITVPNDVSSMAFPIALALIKNEEITCHNVLLNERRLGFINVLKRSGANISFSNVRISNGEKTGDIIVKKGCLKPLYANETEVCDAIDELTVLAAISLTIEGKHVFCGVSELRHKESNRIEAIVHMAAKCGQQVYFDGENLTVLSNGKLKGDAMFRSFNDHRVAMCETVLAIVQGGGSVDYAPFDVSFPNFEQSLGIRPLRFGVIGSNISQSLSPLLMQFLSSNVDVCCSYNALTLTEDISDDDLLNVIDCYDGLNVTMPFKNRIAKLVNADYPSVNTIGKNIAAQSTDGYGIVKALQRNNVDFADKPLWIVGAGGAAEVCVETLLKHGCRFKIFNRTQERAFNLAQKYNITFTEEQPYGILSFVPECEFEQEFTLPQSCRFVFTAAYTGQSGLKAQALERGITYIDGLEMLYHQGAKSFSLWTSTPVQDDYDGFMQFLSAFKE